MKKHVVTFSTGDSIVLKSDELDQFYCPVCGYKATGDAPYAKDGCASFDICSCGFQYGCDDDLHGKSTSESIARFRLLWLRGVSPAHQIDMPFAQKLRQLQNAEIDIPPDMLSQESE